MASVCETSNRQEIPVSQLVGVLITSSSHQNNPGPSSSLEPHPGNVRFDNPFDLTSIPRVSCVSDTYSMRAPISKWGVTFDDTSSVTDFMERVEEVRLSRRVSKQQLLVSAAEIFSERALVWFRSIRNTISTWDDLS